MLACYGIAATWLLWKQQRHWDKADAAEQDRQAGYTVTHIPNATWRVLKLKTSQGSKKQLAQALFWYASERSNEWQEALLDDWRKHHD